jgi:nucleotide-binding universal stress UspA family protein
MPQTEPGPTPTRDLAARATLASTHHEGGAVPAPYRKIACFIEESHASDLALQEALALRAQSPGELHVVHVATRPFPLFVGMYGSTPPMLEDYVMRADHWLTDRVADIPGATPRLLDGWPPRAACRYVEKEGIDLLVAAAHRGLVERAMLGGFAAYVAYHAPCSVLLVHPPIVAEEAAEDRAEREGVRASAAP